MATDISIDQARQLLRGGRLAAIARILIEEGGVLAFDAAYAQAISTLDDANAGGRAFEHRLRMLISAAATQDLGFALESDFNTAMTHRAQSGYLLGLAVGMQLRLTEGGAR